MNQVYKKMVWKLNQTKEQLEAFQLGEDINSPMVEIMLGGNKTEWFLSFFARGECEKSKDGVGFYLHLDEAGSKKFEAKFTLGVIGEKGNKELTFECPGKHFIYGHGTDDFLKQDELFNLDRGYFVDGKLTLFCQLTLTDDVTGSDGSDDEQALSKPNLISDLKGMLEEELFADFGVETSDGKVLKVHKCILSARSPYFYAMLTSGMKETQENVVKVPEDAEITKAVLSFIYTGEVENLDEIVLELVHVSQKYQLNELKILCIESIIDNLSWGNAVESLLIAEGLTNSKELKEKCIDVIASNLKYLSTTDEWEKLPPGLLTKIILHVVSEIDDTIIV